MCSGNYNNYSPYPCDNFEKLSCKNEYNNNECYKYYNDECYKYYNNKYPNNKYKNRYPQKSDTLKIIVLQQELTLPNTYNKAERLQLLSATKGFDIFERELAC